MAPCIGAGEVIVSNNEEGICPQMEAIADEIFIPVRNRRSFSLTGRNLPVSQVNYRCLLDIQGVQMVVDASLDVDGTSITCLSMYEYDSSDGTLLLNVSVSVEYNPGHVIDDPHNNAVTLYDCGAIGSSCSSCIAPSVPHVLNCGWCPGDYQCRIAGAGCGDYQPRDSTCPPPTISGFSPPSGPLEGNTTLTVFGTDLGQVFSDIINITVAGLDCSLNYAELNYIPGVSVQCITSASVSVLTGAVTVTVQRLVAGAVAEYNMAEFTNTDFSYKNPTLTGFSPRIGIRAGGTLVTLTGTDLDTGNNRQVIIGGAHCQEAEGILTSTSVECYTGESVRSGSGGSSVVIAFDAGQRQAPDSFNYAPNPTVTDFLPKESIYSGGIEIYVHGTGFRAVQSTVMIVSNNGIQISQPCDDATKSDEEIVCLAPSLESRSRSRRQAGNQGNNLVDVIFAFDGYIYPPRQVTYCPDPVYFSLADGVYQLEEGETLLEIQGSNLDCIKEDPDSYIEVCVGTGRGTVIDRITNALLTVILPTEEPEGGGCDGETLSGCIPDLPCLVVKHGRNLNFTLGNIRYYVAPNPVPVIVGTVAGVFGLIIIIFIVFAIISYRNYRKEKDLIEQQMRAAEMCDF